MYATITDPIELKPVAERGLGRQLVHNSIATFVFYIISALVGIWYVPFIVKNLGVSQYAVAQLAAGFIGYMQFVTTGIAGSVGRFVTADFARNDLAAANRTFNTYLVAAERVTLILSVVIGVVVWLVVPLLEYPPSQLSATRFVFAAILFSAVIQVWCMCFDCAFWVSGRFDIRNAVLIVELLIRTGTVYALFHMTQPSLWHIGIACLLAPIGSLMLYILAWSRLTPSLSISRKLFDRDRFGEIRGLGGWLLILQFGGVLQFNSELLVLNLLLGNKLQGSYGILLVWVTILRGLFSSLGQLISPSIAALHASGETKRLASLSRTAVRAQGLLIAIPVGVLCGLAGAALNWWMGPEFRFLAPLAWLILVPLVIEGSFNPVSILVSMPDTVKFFAKSAVVIGVANVILGVILVKYTGLGMYGMALAVAITSIIRHGVVMPIYAAHLMKQPWYLLIQQQAQTVIQLGLTGAIALYVAQYVGTARSLPNLVTAAFAAGSVATLLALLQLSRDERTRLIAVIRRR